LAGELVHERPAGREHDVIDLELLDRVLKVVPPRLGEPVMAEGHAEGLHSIDLSQHMQLEGAVLAAADRNNTVVIVPTGPIIVEQMPKSGLPLHPVDVNFLLLRLAGLTYPHLVELHSLI